MGKPTFFQGLWNLDSDAPVSNAAPLPVSVKDLTVTADTVNLDTADLEAKIGSLTESAPANATASSGLNGLLRFLFGLVGALTETAPATDTASSGLSGRLQRIAQNLTTSNRILNATGSTLTRPTNTTPYTANDSISDNGTAASVTANTVTLSDTNDAPVGISMVELHSTDTGIGGKNVRIWVYNSDPTASSGVQAGDNAAFSNKKAGFVGTLSGTMRSFSDGARGLLAPDDGLAAILAAPESGGKRFWWQLQTLSDFTPSANSTTFIPKFKGFQGVV